jgi:hypothetical protein
VLLFPFGVKLPAPDLAHRSAFRRGEEVLQRDVEEGGAGLGQDLVAVAERAVDADPAASAIGHPGRHRQCAVDEDGAPIADKDSRGHRRKPVPRREKPARLVEGGADEAAVDDPRRGLVPLGEREGGLVAVDSLLGGRGKVDPFRIIATAPARRIVMGRDALAFLAGAACSRAKPDSAGAWLR